MKDGDRVYPYGKYEMKQDPDGTVELTVKGVKTEDAGCYRCVAENDTGSARTTAEVTVERMFNKCTLYQITQYHS